MGDTGAVRITLKMEQLLAIPELEAGKRELLDGELIDSTLFNFRHAEIAHRLLKILETVAVTAGMRGSLSRDRVSTGAAEVAQARSQHHSS